MKQIMAMIMTVCVILGTVTGCGEKQKNEIAILELVENLSTVQSEKFMISSFTSIEKEGEHYCHSEIIPIQTGEKIGEILVSEVGNNFHGAMVRSYWTSLPSEAYAMQLVKDLGISPKNCATIKEKIIDSAYLDKNDCLDADGYRVSGMTTIEKDTHKPQFIFLIQRDIDLKDYQEGNLFSSDDGHV